MAFLRCTTATCLVLVLVSGCGSDKADMSPERLRKLAGTDSLETVVPISGNVVIDGESAVGVNVYLYAEVPSTPLKESRTDDEGHFCFTTYVACDGVKPGNYKLGFEYVPKMKKNGTGPDLFKGKYKNPAKNDFKLTVEEGSPQTDLNYELKLK